MVKRIIAKQEACMGCGLCEVYCTVQHSKSKDIVKAYNSERPKPNKQNNVEETNPSRLQFSAATAKTHPCVTACLSGAMQKDEKTGQVTHNKDKCIGCWTCIMVCPYGAIKMDKEGHVVAKCDLCQGFDEPACVANCPNEALVFKEVKA
jgi:carbon-monoxide dehydrogenase iron sulfur subunit